ncbi:uncharacterized protein Ecym_6123 [Eremothecium cymbalariae DBVPG|uniref:Protein YIP n=1 Tax=Eremothecium cymbalariae (strain CBS 270.75 / DBVPG 7215 / KCTC 17166 / NRRL Y-17582) TaxID=931890 RepID=G8JV37_ERECY|nr:hypothetical protein Ecym_6123 [Eremothecium cymbalariae DBVPG\
MSHSKYTTVDPEDDILFSVDDEPNFNASTGDTGVEGITGGYSSADQTKNEVQKRGLFNALAPYYQITSEQLYHKIATSVMFGKVHSAELGPNANIEVYSTIWVIISVVVSLYISYGGKQLVEHMIAGSKISDDKGTYTVLLGVFFLFTGYVVAVPLILKAVVTYVFNENLGAVELIQWYGLSCVVWIPLALVSVLTSLLPKGWNALVEWLLTAVGGAYGFGIIYKQIQDDLNELSKKQAVSIAMVVLHFVFVIGVRHMIF